ncbi:MAG: hypothetical protein IPO21_19840 [Bacteroidales bacterium]|nr:hypothetical protein [Bacteroidales bacterium]
MVKTQVDPASLTVEDKLKALFRLQITDSKIDKFVVLRGELPLEVKDLEDELAGLQTRIQKIKDEVQSKDAEILLKKNEIKESELLIAKYKEQQMQVRNNREYESISKELEFQMLEIELCQKRIKEFSLEVAGKNDIINTAQATFDERSKDLENKNNELSEIINETQKEENELTEKSKELELIIEPRLLYAYKRIRGNARNGLAVVAVQRDACGGCFSKIPPQRQLDIKTHKKIIVCEYCGRILVDGDMIESVNE